MKTVDVDTLNRLLRCDADAGLLFWKETRGAAKKGGAAMSLDGRGYVRVKINGRQFGGHRVVWAMHHGQWSDVPLDHINGDTADNRISNLRPATLAQNARNCKRPKHNSSGFKGVCLHRDTGKFQAQIKVDKANIYLGLFPTAEDAHAAYVSAAIKYHGEFHNAG